MIDVLIKFIKNRFQKKNNSLNKRGNKPWLILKIRMNKKDLKNYFRQKEIKLTKDLNKFSGKYIYF